MGSFSCPPTLPALVERSRDRHRPTRPAYGTRQPCPHRRQQTGSDSCPTQGTGRLIHTKSIKANNARAAASLKRVRLSARHDEPRKRPAWLARALHCRTSTPLRDYCAVTSRTCAPCLHDATGSHESRETESFTVREPERVEGRILA